MSDLIVKEVNAETGAEIIREMTAEESAAWLIQQQLAEETLTAETMKKEAIQEALLSAKTKLAALGLTAEEVKVIFGS
jgi:hypothetical protein